MFSSLLNLTLSIAVVFATHVASPDWQNVRERVACLLCAPRCLLSSFHSLFSRLPFDFERRSSTYGLCTYRIRFNIDFITHIRTVPHPQLSYVLCTGTSTPLDEHRLMTGWLTGWLTAPHVPIIYYYYFIKWNKSTLNCVASLCVPVSACVSASNTHYSVFPTYV